MVEQEPFRLHGDSWEPGQRLLKVRVAEAVKRSLEQSVVITCQIHFRSGFHSKLTEFSFKKLIFYSQRDKCQGPINPLIWTKLGQNEADAL